MRKPVFLVVMLLITSVYEACAQSRTVDLSTNIIAVGARNISINVGYNFETDLTAGCVIGYANSSFGSGALEDAGLEDWYYPHRGFYLAPEFRLYLDPSVAGNDGYFAGAYLKYRDRENLETLTGYNEFGTPVLYDVEESGVLFGLLGGFHYWWTNKGIMLQIWGGLGYSLYNHANYTNDYDPAKDPNRSNNALRGFDVRLGYNIGYRF